MKNSDGVNQARGAALDNLFPTIRIYSGMLDDTHYFRSINIKKMKGEGDVKRVPTHPVLWQIPEANCCFKLLNP
jgi:hypothetical protein